MSQIIKSRLNEVCPSQTVSEMDIIEVEKSCHIAFEIIGYLPKNFTVAFQKTWESFDGEMLCDFIYKVWEADR